MFRRPFSPHLAAALVLMLTVPSYSAAQPAADRSGILVIAHGATAAWNAPVLAAVTDLRRTRLAAVGFLMGDGPSPQDGYDALVRQGATRVVIVPLLISSHSAHYEQIRFLAGLRPDYQHAEHMALSPLAGPVPVMGVTPAMDDDPMIGDILTDRARALSHEPARETLVLVAHGPNGDDEAAIWLSMMRRLARHVRAAVPFRAIETHLLRDDAPRPVKDRALSELREAVARHVASGSAVVLPVLLSPGQVANEIPRVLQGLSVRWDGRTLLPDERIARWMLSRARTFEAAHAAGGGSGALSAERGAVEGTVRDMSDLPVAGALVVLRETTSGIERTSQADASGHFRFGSIGDGSYELVVSVTGFAGLRRQIEVPTVGPLALVLRPATYQETVTVVSDARRVQLRDGTTVPVSVVDGQAMRDAGDTTVGEALRALAGVVTRRGSEGAAVAGQQIQGVDSRQVLVLVDGQPIVGARGIKSGAIDLDRQPVHFLDRIEVVRGAASAVYGSDAIGGVINLIPRDPRHPLEVSGSVAGGSDGATDGSADVGGFAPWGTWMVGGGRHARDAFDLTPTTADTTGAAFRRTDLNARVMLAPSRRWTLTGTATSYWNRQVGRSNGELGPEAGRTDTNAQTYGARASWQAGANTALEFRGYRGRYAERSTGHLLDAAQTDVEPGDLFEGLSKLDASVAQVVGRRQQLRGGLEWMRDAYRGHNRLRDLDGDAATLGSGWVEYAVSPLGGVTATAGLRADTHSTFGSALSPKLAVVDRVTDWLTARASFSRGFRAPDLGQLYYRFLNPTNLYQVIGNPHLQPERASSWQSGVELAWGGRVHAMVNVFHNRVEHLIQAVNLGFIRSADDLAEVSAAHGITPDFEVQLNRLLFLYQNVAHARTQGADVSGDLRLGDAWRLAGSYTLLDAVDADTGAELPNRHRHQGTVRLDWTPARLGIRANLRGAFYSSWIAGSSRSVAGTSAIIAPRFAVWDLTVSKALRRPVAVFLKVDNLTDSQDPNTGRLSGTGTPLPIYRPEIGRAFAAGVRWSWNR